MLSISVRSQLGLLVVASDVLKQLLGAWICANWSLIVSFGNIIKVLFVTISNLSSAIRGAVRKGVSFAWVKHTLASSRHAASMEFFFQMIGDCAIWVCNTDC